MCSNFDWNQVYKLQAFANETKSPLSGPWFVLALTGIRRLVVQIKALEKTIWRGRRRTRTGADTTSPKGSREPQESNHLFRSLVCTGACRNPAICGTNRGNFKKAVWYGRRRIHTGTDTTSQKSSRETSWAQLRFPLNPAPEESCHTKKGTT